MSRLPFQTLSSLLIALASGITFAQVYPAKVERLGHHRPHIRGRAL
jgi:hypothetical protein